MTAGTPAGGGYDGGRRVGLYDRRTSRWAVGGRTLQRALHEPQKKDGRFPQKKILP